MSGEDYCFPTIRSPHTSYPAHFLPLALAFAFFRASAGRLAFNEVAGGVLPGLAESKMADALPKPALTAGLTAGANTADICLAIDNTLFKIAWWLKFGKKKPTLANKICA